MAINNIESLPQLTEYLENRVGELAFVKLNGHRLPQELHSYVQVTKEEDGGYVGSVPVQVAVFTAEHTNEPTYSKPKLKEIYNAREKEKKEGEERIRKILQGRINAKTQTNLTERTTSKRAEVMLNCLTNYCIGALEKDLEHATLPTTKMVNPDQKKAKQKRRLHNLSLHHMG